MATWDYPVANPYKEVIKEAIQSEIEHQLDHQANLEPCVLNLDVEALTNAVVMSLGHEGYAIFQP